MNKIYINIKYIHSVIKQKLSSNRFFTFVLLLLFVLWIYLSPIREFSTDMNYPSSPWSLIIVTTELYFQVFFIFLITYYFSDVPFMNITEMYSIIRTGRLRWALGKIFSIIILSFGISILMFLLSFIPLIGRLQCENDWGKLLYTMCSPNTGSTPKLLLKYDIITIYTPLQAFFTLFTICGLLISFMGLLMYCMSIVFSRLWSVCCIFIISVFGIIANNLKLLYPAILYISPVSWLSLNNVALDSGHFIPTFSYIVTVLTSAIVILSIIILIRVKTINFDFNKED